MADPIRLRIDELDAASLAMLTHLFVVAETDGTTEKLSVQQLFDLLSTQPSVVGSIGETQDIASAATLDLTAAPAFRYRVTGAVGITAINIGPNRRAFLRFSATPVVTHNATTLILPTDANITAAVDDIAMLESDGAGNVRVAAWFRKDGTAVGAAAVATAVLQKDVNPGATQSVASASTTNLSASPAFRYLITGTTTITTLTLGANKWALVRFAGALTLTHDATKLILPGAVNIVTAANDFALIETDGSGNVRVLDYVRASGILLPLRSALIEKVFTITDAVAFPINPTNGATQFVTLGANRTPVPANWVDGQSVTLRIADGTAFAITWSSFPIVWRNGIAPTLAATGYTEVNIERAGAVYRGVVIGDFTS